MSHEKFHLVDWSPRGRRHLADTTSPSAFRYHSMCVKPLSNRVASTRAPSRRAASSLSGRAADHRGLSLVGARDQEDAGVPGDVVEEPARPHRDGVEGVLLAVDELLHRHLVEVLDPGSTVSTRASTDRRCRRSPRRRSLDDDREPMRSAARAPRPRARGGVPRRAVPRRRAPASCAPCCERIVRSPESPGAPPPRDLRGEDHRRLPEALDAVDDRRPASGDRAHDGLVFPLFPFPQRSRHPQLKAGRRKKKGGRLGWGRFPRGEKARPEGL